MSEQSPLVRSLTADAPAVAANADKTTILGEAPFDGVVTAVSFMASAVLTGADTESRTLSIVNKGQAGSGTDEIAAKAFISGVNAPAADETALNLAGTLQVETATVVGTITTAGNATVIVTADGMTGSPKTKSVAVALGDTANKVGGKIRTALAADADISDFFDVSGTGANVVLTAKEAAIDDQTMNIDINNGTCAGLTDAPTSTNTVAGGDGAIDDRAVAAGDVLAFISTHVGTTGLADPGGHVEVEITRS
jgi:hypothetical protein